jgi:hypothetical protein
MSDQGRFGKIPFMFFVFAAQDSTECSTNNKTLKALFFTRQQGDANLPFVALRKLAKK